MSRSIWITGMGTVTPFGWSVGDTWRGIVGNLSAIRAFERFPLYDVKTRVAGTVPGVETPVPDDVSLPLRFAESAVAEAIEDAGLEGQPVDLAVVANHGDWRLPQASGDTCKIVGIGDVARAVGRAALAQDSIGLYGTCAGGALAVGTAMRMLAAGRAETAIAGGSDSMLREMAFFRSSTFFAMTTRDCAPVEASCPFDARRDGFVPSEGAGFLVLETETHARARGATLRARLAGFGCSQNAYHFIASPPDAVGPARAMEAAIRDAGLTPHDIDYVNAHGTSTRDNDLCETRAMRGVFGDRARSVPISSSKSQIGHMIAGAGAVEAIICVRALEESILPPTINLCELDPECDLDYVPLAARPGTLRHILSNSFGFGGYNACLLLSKSA